MTPTPNMGTARVSMPSPLTVEDIRDSVEHDARILFLDESIFLDRRAERADAWRFGARR